ncbi:aminotransferase class I/II-fold pyridoxal phosphate-dependent enzyme [Streptomyces neyagawaensis]|uniref:aminotransferase class I/II-fold pyridoxal phosphate-dependent enzyme n=1 Tax=Streptomyces neyagawaensis TaxID=42238 RepID=UPI0006E21ABF|nr:aminotransferase class I/II-fold pyridoxal phosphate-dependent enzyme [Streptomyces neyagawaensis]MCL6738342.1 aminotransferase class I/II-fold pyridoxal phosphate-dependent enzyme [Streptomyces neyagawaensis]MDE1688149.1 aminotransferase class I/II-fold pyridoxal phosphate-dependent enzyme [Streptomyces neyagawaensis]
MAVYIALVGIATSLYMTTPAARAPLWPVIGLAGAAAILTGAHIHRPAHRWPWWMLAAGLLALSAGDTYYNAQEAYFRAPHPFPSLADACHLAVYPLLAAGLFGLVRYRWVDRDLPSLLDALIITAGLALPVWVYLVRPPDRLEGLSWQQRAISIAYPLGDVLLLAMLARLLAPTPLPGGNRAVQLLVLGTVTLLGLDIAYGILQLNGARRAGTLLDSGWIVLYAAWGLAALHPSMAALTASVSQPHSLRPPWPRLVLLAAATLVAPGILLYEGQVGTVSDTTGFAAFSSALFLLVIFRLGGMIVAHRKAVARELALRAATASLVAAERPQEIAQSCDTAVTSLFGPKVRHGSMLLSAKQAQDLYALQDRSPDRPGDGPVTGTGATPEDGPDGLALHHTLMVPVAALGPRIATELGDLPTALLCPMIQSDRPAGCELPGVLLVAGPERRLTDMRGSLEILASHAGLATERIGLRQEITRKESEAYFRTLVHNASDVILIVDDDTTVRYASPSAEAMFGIDRLIGTALRELVDPRDRHRANRALTAMRDSGRQEAHDHWWVLRDSGRIEVEVRCRDLRHDKTVNGTVVTLRDVTEQRQLEHELTQRAFHDPLTGLPNRTLLLERTERAMLRGRRESTLTCLLFIDLDDFKLVNDTLGHSVGDRLLGAVGERLSETLRRTDTAARLGGDEFAVLMEDAKQPLDAELLAAQVIHTLNRPFQLSEDSVSVSASVGVATAMDSEDAEELLAHADLALYAAKAAGKRQWRRFQSQLRVRMMERHDLQAHLDRAIAREEFALRYQPVVDIIVGDVVGFEALARWEHTRRGLLPPQQFISLAEETGHITLLGAWVLQKASSDIARLQHQTQRSAPPYLSVNVSARQFRDAGFLDEVGKALDTPGLVPGSLQLELTESVLIQRDDQIDALIRALKDLGVRIAVDAFGTGFSSLRYLREFPLDVLKIDKTFIDDITRDPQQVALVEGIVHIADTLGLEVIAEGIEEPAQRELLAGIGCRFGQGYLFARPMTVAQSEVVLRQRNEAQSSPRDSGAAARGPRGIRARTAPGGTRPVGGEPGADDRTAADEEREERTAKPGTTAAEPPRTRRDPRWGDLEHLRQTSPMSDAVMDEVLGRHIRSGDHWLIDFASCNYLGFDWGPEIIGAIEPAVRHWGTHPSWPRLLGSPRLYLEIEERLTGLLGAPDTLLLPTSNLIHASVIPVLTGQGYVFVEATAHRTVYDGCVSAQGQGATLQRFHADRPDQLDDLLRAVPSGRSRLVCLDGVDRMTGNMPALPELVGVCRDRGATLYIDDTHGFGVIGERKADELCPYGSRGNGVVRHMGETYDGIVLVGGFSNAYSSMLAFIALPTWLKNHLKTAAAPYLFSGPSPTASLATTLAGLEVNDRRGDAIRADLHRKTVRVLDHVLGLGLDTPSVHRLPIVEIPLVNASDLGAVAGFLWDHGIYVTLAAYPLVPHDLVGLRIQITALHSDEDIDRLNETLTALSERFALRQIS